MAVDLVGPADPFAAVVAVLGSLWPAGPSFAMVLLWILALPLAVLGGWFAATRVTDRAGLRIFAGVAWALAPTFLTALVEGRPTAVLVHLLLPWLFHTAVVAHRSWGAAGSASLLLAAVLACAPSLSPALAVLWVVALGIVLGTAQFRGAGRLLWLPVPAIVLFAPLVFWQLAHGTPLALLGDPGVIWAGPQAAADAAGRLALATGFPTPTLAGWMTFLPDSLGAWAALFCAPIALLALGAAVAPRWRAGITLLVVALTGLATSFVAVGITVSFAQGTPVAIWPGAGLSLAWVGVVGAALVTLDTAITLPRLRVVAATVAALALAVCAVPALTAVHANRSVLTNGPESTLPAYVAAQAAGDQPIATLILTPQNDGGLAVEVAWGASETLGSQTTMISTATEPQGSDISTLAVDLLSARDFDAPGELAAMGISYVLVAQVPGEGDKARTLRTAAVASIDQRAGLLHAGKTDRGVLWRLEADITDPPTLTSAQEGTARLVITLQLLAVLAALLLSIPTRASRRAARAQSRIVGRAADEPLVLPRHAEDREFLDAEPPVGTIEDPQDAPALNDDALVPIAEPRPVDEDPPGSSAAHASSDGHRSHESTSEEEHR